MNCLSVRQPWASAIIAGVKTVENRSWPPPPSVIGPENRLWIHASRSTDALTSEAVLNHLGDHWPAADLISMRGLCGHVIGSVVVTGWSTWSESTAHHAENPWAIGPVLWYLSDPVPCSPFPASGKLKIFQL